MSNSFINRQIKANNRSIFNKDGTKKDYVLIDEEIKKLEEQRPKRYKRNGKEIKNDILEDVSKEVEQLRRDRCGADNYKKIKLLKNSNRINLEGFNTPCIYILYKEDEMVYIGETTSFSKRLAQHITEGKKCFDSFKLRYFIDNDKVRKNKEKRMIKKFKPKYNIIHNKTNK